MRCFNWWVCFAYPQRLSHSGFKQGKTRTKTVATMLLARCVQKGASTPMGSSKYIGVSIVIVESKHQKFLLLTKWALCIWGNIHNEIYVLTENVCGKPFMMKITL